MFLLLLCTIASAAEDIHVVKENETVEISGPSAWMTEPAYRRYVADSRKLDACEEDLELAIDKGIEANQRAIRARDIATAEFDSDELLINELVQSNADLGARLDRERMSKQHIRAQRNVAWAITGGLLTAALASTTIALSSVAGP